jgi:hypothetical protein
MAPKVYQEVIGGIEKDGPRGKIVPAVSIENQL